MRGPTDELMKDVMRLASRLCDGRGGALLAEARAEAEAEVKALLKSAIKAALLQSATASRASTPDAPAETKPQSDLGPAASARYVYGIARSDHAGLARDVHGIDDRRNFDIIRHDGIAAITTPVVPGDFDAETLRQRVEDPQWLERSVRAHEGVLRAAMAAGPVVPLRFCTVLRCAADVARVLEAHRDRVSELLAYLDAKREWGMKVFWRQPTGSSDATEANSGRDYLTRRHRAVRGSDRRSQTLRELAIRCHKQLAALADAAVELPRHKLTAGQESSGGELLLLNAAYLVAAAREEEFHATVASLCERIAEEQLTCEVTGPWPPYSFVNLDLSLPALQTTTPAPATT